MRNLPILLSLLLLMIACDDGDVIEFELDFEEELTLCDENQLSYVLYKTKDEPNESLTLLFPKSGNSTIFRPTLTSNTRTEITIDGNSTKFNYRTYNDDPSGVICAQIIDPNVRIVSDYPAAPGAKAVFTTTFEDDDNDGVEYDIENPDNLPFDEAPDTDGDGIPDYADADDDNDNVLTIAELGNAEDGEPMDTDDDGIPDYLDEDDDGDGILTRREDENLDGNPRNDIFIDAENINNLPRYLYPAAKIDYDQTNFEATSYERLVSVQVSIINADIEVLRFDTIDFGTYTSSFDPIEDEE